MNMNEALDKAAIGMAALEQILGEMKKDGIVEILIAGASGSGIGPDADFVPDVGVFLSMNDERVQGYAAEIREATQAVQEGGVRVIVFPKPF